MTMAIHKWLLFLFWHIHLPFLIQAQLSDIQYFQCNSTLHYTENSAYQKNLKSLLSSLPSKIDQSGFYYNSIGQNTDKASGVVLCRGDLEMEECRSCVKKASQKLVLSCPNQKDAVGGYDECWLQYSSQSILDTTSLSSLYYLCNSANASKPEEFNQDLIKLLENLKDRAANGGSYRNYASGNVSGPDQQHIYAFVQCTPDLSPQKCSDRLSEAYGNSSLCNSRKGGRIIGPRCNFRYENYSFFSASEPPRPAENDDKTARSLITIIVPTVTIVIIIVCMFVVLMKKRKRQMADKIQGTLGDDISKTESLQYDFSTIRAATNNFSNANKLGQGGFGPVYKGELPNGQEVAVKRLSANSGQGDLEFKNEVLLVAKLQHRSLVRLLGFCLDGTETSHL